MFLIARSATAHQPSHRHAVVRPHSRMGPDTCHSVSPTGGCDVQRPRAEPRGVGIRFPETCRRGRSRDTRSGVAGAGGGLGVSLGGRELSGNRCLWFCTGDGLNAAEPFAVRRSSLRNVDLTSVFLKGGFTKPADFCGSLAPDGSPPRGPWQGCAVGSFPPGRPSSWFCRGQTAGASGGLCPPGSSSLLPTCSGQGGLRPRPAATALSLAILGCGLNPGVSCSFF